MPGQARLDVPGALTQIIVRGIKKARIFEDNQDKNKFLFGPTWRKALLDTGGLCGTAWIRDEYRNLQSGGLSEAKGAGRRS
jgi:hypothetical protein